MTRTSRPRRSTVTVPVDGMSSMRISCSLIVPPHGRPDSYPRSLPHRLRHHLSEIGSVTHQRPLRGRLRAGADRRLRRRPSSAGGGTGSRTGPGSIRTVTEADVPLRLDAPREEVLEHAAKLVA